MTVTASSLSAAGAVLDHIEVTRVEIGPGGPAPPGPGHWQRTAIVTVTLSLKAGPSQLEHMMSLKLKLPESLPGPVHFRIMMIAFTVASLRAGSPPVAHFPRRLSGLVTQARAQSRSLARASAPRGQGPLNRGCTESGRGPGRPGVQLRLELQWP